MIGTNKQFASAQHSHDNKSDDFDDDYDYPETMKCTECGAVVELERNGIDIGTGYCPKCYALCEYEIED